MTNKPIFVKKGYQKDGIQFKPVFFHLKLPGAEMELFRLRNKGHRAEIHIGIISMPSYSATTKRVKKVKESAWIVYDGGKK